MCGEYSAVMLLVILMRHAGGCIERRWRAEEVVLAENSMMAMAGWMCVWGSTGRQTTGGRHYSELILCSFCNWNSLRRPDVSSPRLDMCTKLTTDG
jgi:hypothetical protein